MDRCKVIDDLPIGPYTAQRCELCDALYVFRKDGRLKAFFDRDGAEMTTAPYVCFGSGPVNTFSQIGQEVHVGRDARDIYYAVAPDGSLEIVKPMRTHSRAST